MTPVPIASAEGAVWCKGSLLQPGREERFPDVLFAEHWGPSAAALLQVAESMLQTFLEYNSSMAKTGDFRDVHKEDLLRVGTTLAAVVLKSIVLFSGISLRAPECPAVLVPCTCGRSV